MMNKIVVIVGPTAVGKTEYAIKIANKFNGEIISCDSMQVYKHLEIGSAKPTHEERQMAVHHLVDEIDPIEEDFSVAIYSEIARKYIDNTLSKGKLPVIAGGTGLYLNSILYDMDFSEEKSDIGFRKKYEAMAEEKGKVYVHNILKNLDEKTAQSIHPNNLVKTIRAIEILSKGKEKKEYKENDFKKSKYKPILICLDRNRDELYNRINIRVDKMMEMGLVDEVENLLKLGIPKTATALKAIGYKEIIQYLDGELALDEAIDLVKKNSRRYAKRQLTWFRRYENMEWFNLSQANLEDVIKWLTKKV